MITIRNPERKFWRKNNCHSGLIIGLEGISQDTPWCSEPGSQSSQWAGVSRVYMCPSFLENTFSSSQDRSVIWSSQSQTGEAISQVEEGHMYLFINFFHAIEMVTENR